jgi:hypothetical protein
VERRFSQGIRGEMKDVNLFFGRVARYGKYYIIGEWNFDKFGNKTPFFNLTNKTRKYTQKEIEDKYNITIDGNRISIVV